MSQGPHITDSHFNEIYGPHYHEEDRSQNYYHNDRRHYGNSSGPHIYMPPGHQSPPNQGTVNIGFASGNVNTGPVNGSLYQSEGVKRTPAAPQPSRPPPPFLTHESLQNEDHVPRSQRWVAYHTEPMSDVPPPFPQPSVRHNRYPDERAGSRAYPYEPQPQHRKNSHHQEYNSRDYFQGSRDPPHGRHEEPYYNDSPPRPPPREQRGQYSPEPPSQDHPFVQSPTASERHFPMQPTPVKDRNPFRNMTVDAAPAAYPYSPPSRPPAQKAATLSDYPTSEYTSSWVAGHASHDNTSPTQSRKWNGSPLEEDDRAFHWNVRTPSCSSATSSSPPGFQWSRSYSRTSSATTYSRFSPVPEDEGCLRVNAKFRSRSPTPDLK